MKENALLLLEFTSVRSLDYLLKNLNEPYVPSGVRKGVNRLLRRLIELSTNDQEKNEAIVLQYYFSKPATKNGYIDTKPKDKACALLQDMRNALVECSSPVEKLLETIANLRIDNSDKKSSLISRIYFRQLLIEDDFIPEFAEIVNGLQITQYQIKKTTSQILLFGVLKDEVFWVEFQDLWKRSPSLPPFDDTKKCFLYYGGSEVPLPNPEDQYLIPGDCLNSHVSCFDPLITQIPGKLDSFIKV